MQESQMVAIRLRRAGSKKRPFFRVVVTDSRAARDSSFVEILGHYNPRTKPALVDVNKERVDYWIKQGARPSDTVRTLMARHLTVKPAAAETAPAKTADQPVKTAERPAAATEKPAETAETPSEASER
jgi:small subunit ribosomal protein S16